MESIREATQNDKEQVYRLLVALEETNIDYKFFSDIYDMNLSNSSVFYFVHEKEDMILGFISIHVQKLLHHTANIAEIQELIVDEKIRNQGVGKRLFQKAKEIATKEGCEQLEVCCKYNMIAGL